MTHHRWDRYDTAALALLLLAGLIACGCWAWGFATYGWW